jgi:hypothetical protein
MKIKRSLILGITLLFGSVAFAQDDHKIEGTVDYSYVHANPQNNNIIPTFSLNGGGGSIAYYFTKLIGNLKAMAAIPTTLLSLRRTATVPVPYRLKGICSPTTLARS